MMKVNEYRQGNSIYIWRIVFTVLIMVMHFNNVYSKIYENPHITGGWYIAVEFFFIVSGYLLMARAEVKGKEESALRYTAGRYIKLYPEYLFALLLPWLLNICIGARGKKESLLMLMDNWEELFMLQCTGLNRFPFMSNVTWYISVMLIAGFLIYHCVTCYRETYVKFILPILLVVIYSYLHRRNADMDHWIYTDGVWLNEAVLRGLLDMNLGVAVYLLHARAEKIQWSKLGRYIMLAGEILSYSFVIIMSLRHKGDFDFLFLFILAFAVLLSFMNGFFIRFHTSKFIKYLDELCYAVYLNHNLWNGWILPRFWNADEWHLSWVILYVLFVFVYSAFTHWLVAKCVKLIKYAGRKCIKT
jgi:hypothetical protein